LAGQEVTLQDDLKDYYILIPVLSKLRIPAPPSQVVEVWMLPKSLKVELGANFIERFIEYAADNSPKHTRDPKSGAPDMLS
jgi:hypothetical protein